MVVGCVARVMWWMASSHTDGQDTWFVHKIKNDSILFLEMVDKHTPIDVLSQWSWHGCGLLQTSDGWLANSHTDGQYTWFGHRIKDARVCPLKWYTKQAPRDVMSQWSRAG